MELFYNNYTIIIFQQDPIKVEQLNYDISFLYSNKQNIEIKDGIESYNIKFYIEKYTAEILYIYGKRNNSLFLDNCKKKDNELNCEISKEKLEEILIENNEQFKVGEINDTIGIINFDSIPDININYEIDKKEDIYVKINNLISNHSLEGAPIVFETNVTSIPNINSDIFNSCYFKKNKGTPLLYLCNFNRNISSYGIFDELIINNSHYKYNFRIQPFKQIYYFKINKKGVNISFVYPEILNFTFEQPILTIRYIMSNPSLAKDLKLIPTSDYLECIDVNGLKKCTVPLKDFIGKTNGYYYIYINQTFYYKESFLHYESSPIKIIVPEDILEINVNSKDNEEYTIIGKNGFFSIVTNYTDEKNIFEFSDIEEKTRFNIFIPNYNKNGNLYYKVDCRLWKPKNDKIKILCKLTDYLGLSPIKIKSTLFSYKKYKFVLKSFQIFAIQTIKNIPYLYSDKNIINIEEDKPYYDLKFKIEEYNNEPLFLKRKNESEDNYLTEWILEDYNVEGKDLTCKIEKDKIIENLYYNVEIFELYYYFSWERELNKFSGVSDIIINYNVSKKEDIFIGLTKLLQNNLDSRYYISYETNITYISNILTDYFSYVTNINSYFCRMKKSTNKPLLFFCYEKKYKTSSYFGKKNRINIK